MKTFCFFFLLTITACGATQISGLPIEPEAQSIVIKVLKGGGDLISSCEGGNGGSTIGGVELDDETLKISIENGNGCYPGNYVLVRCENIIVGDRPQIDFAIHYNVDDDDICEPQLKALVHISRSELRGFTVLQGIIGNKVRFAAR